MSPHIVHLHPNAALSISDYLNRLKHVQDDDFKVGGLLGKLGKDSTSILYSFEISSTEYSDIASLHKHYELISQIYGNDYLEIVGFYKIGNLENSTLLKIASNSTNNSLQTIEIDKKISSIIKLELSDFILLELDVNATDSDEINQFWKFKNLCNYTPIDCDIKYTLSEQISMNTYNDIPQAKEGISSDISTSIEPSFAEISSKLHRAISFLKSIEKREIDIENNSEYKQKFQSLSKLAHKIVILEELVREQKCNTDQEINELIAIRSSYSSLMQGNIFNS